MADVVLGTVLNVNDNEASRYLASRILEMAGFRVVEAATGHAALQLARREQPDVVVLDIKLPDLDGFEVCRRLRADPVTASIAVMQTSATFVSAEKKAHGLDSGADAYLTQPFEPSELIATVKSLLRMRRAEQELRRRADVLVEADRRKDEFLAMLAHELRNPLAAILTAVGILERRPSSDEKEVRMRSIIHRQTTHLARLVDDLLDVSRITRGRVELKRQRMDLRQGLQQVLQVMRPLAEQRGLTVDVDLADEPLWIDADPTRLEQVLTNLLDNAAKYTDAGGSLRVTARREGVDGSARAVVRVRDTGIGIPAEQLPRVFELFAQVDESLERSRGGLGIGLTLVQHLVQMHGGEIVAFSEGPGQGSEFTLRLPLVHVRPEQVAQLAPAPGSRSRSVLLVEDNADARQAMQDLLELWGHNVVAVAPDGEKGLALALAHRPELAVVDIGLPGLDGYRVAQELRARVGNTIRLVALTGYGGPDDHKRALEAGFDVHLVKPVQPDELGRLLEQL